MTFAQFHDRPRLLVLRSLGNGAGQLAILRHGLTRRTDAAALFIDALLYPGLRRAHTVANAVVPLLQINTDQPVRHRCRQFRIIGIESDPDNIARALTPDGERTVIAGDYALHTILAGRLGFSAAEQAVQRLLQAIDQRGLAQRRIEFRPSIQLQVANNTFRNASGEKAFYFRRKVQRIAAFRAIRGQRRDQWRMDHQARLGVIDGLQAKDDREGERRQQNAQHRDHHDSPPDETETGRQVEIIGAGCNGSGWRIPRGGTRHIAGGRHDECHCSWTSVPLRAETAS
ncbi:MAG TPA: hypothetical protein VHC00_17865 [Rhizobiaceae bacterium]|nr:hypothetical protein [Rhizobiaceae bacterium]